MVADQTHSVDITTGKMLGNSFGDRGLFSNAQDPVRCHSTTVKDLIDQTSSAWSSVPVGSEEIENAIPNQSRSNKSQHLRSSISVRALNYAGPI